MRVVLHDCETVDENGVRAVPGVVMVARQAGQLQVVLLRLCRCGGVGG